MRVSLFFLFFSFAISGFAHAQTSEESTQIPEAKKALITQLIEITGAKEIGETMSRLFVQQLNQALKGARPDIDPKAFDIIEEEVNQTISQHMSSQDGLYSHMYPIYNRYFTESELQALINFYNTDIGRKTIRVMPMVFQDSIQVGQAWGQQLGPLISERVQQRLAEEGIDY